VEAGNKIADEARTLSRQAIEELSDARGLAREALAEIAALSRMFDGHLEWSQETVDEIWKAMKERNK
jgi:hypothetical protein